MKRLLSILSAILCLQNNAVAQPAKELWHGIEREVRYHPEGTDIVIENGTKRFNRALYGGNTAFRAEAGDLPEFALYMPGMGGNLKFGFIIDGKSKWLIESRNIKTIYRAGSMLYEVRDPLLNEGVIYLQAIALYDSEGFIVRLHTKNVPASVQLIAVYGGATGKKFSRDGDIGADPESSFYLKSDYCKDNLYRISQNSFQLLYGFAKPLSEEERYEVQHLPSTESRTTATEKAKEIAGVFPFTAVLRLADANHQQSPIRLLNTDSAVVSPLVTATMRPDDREMYYFLLQKPGKETVTYNSLPAIFEQAEAARQQLAGRIKIQTPDSLINTLGPVLGIAADAVWEDPSFMHGAVAWRMRLNGWRGAYAADVLGWHDRAKKHFDGYALSQIKTPLTGPVVADTALHLGRQQEKLGTSLFSSGYISRNPGGDLRAHHYDMNLVFVDQLLNHFNWTGDTAYVKQMWPLLVRHLDWEKRNFDADGDGLYDSYAAIWASDALQYSGGGVTHSSAYNYRANKTVAELARLIGEDGRKYKQEADKILNAINQQLWMEDKGWYAEYKDLLGNQLLHPAAGLWTIYHAIDEKITDPFQAYRSLRYIDHSIPHIPIIAKGLKDSSLYTLSTTNWQPYTWSLNNVALAELLHTALAYWQGGRYEEAFLLWKSSLVESMYLGASPGSIQQLSFYDAIRGELYRDFADPIGMAGRTIVEGLFGVQPDLLHNRLVIKPGFPKQWNHAALETPGISINFQRNKKTDTYIIKPAFSKTVKLAFIVPAYYESVQSITVNGKTVKWKAVHGAVGNPYLQVETEVGSSFSIKINWGGNELEKLFHRKQLYKNERLQVHSKKMKALKVFDPGKLLSELQIANHYIAARLNNKEGRKTFFVNVKQGAFTWWQPVDIYSIEEPGITQAAKATGIFEKADLSPHFNDAVTNIFKNQYLSPRPAVPTLQLPTQGIGNWAYPLVTANISDSGLRVKAGLMNEISIRSIPFNTPAIEKKNIVFISLWDNYPDSITIPLTGKASQAHFLLAGSTNPMQSRLVNGVIVIEYTDGSRNELELKNPENWWPIEQDYYTDGFAFTTGAAKPVRIALKTGEEITKDYKYISIKGFANYAIDGGAATLLEMPLDNSKTLKSLQLRAVANDVVIGLMAITLTR
jgi:hypothetical protein